MSAPNAASASSKSSRKSTKSTKSASKSKRQPSKSALSERQHRARVTELSRALPKRPVKAPLSHADAEKI